MRQPARNLTIPSIKDLTLRLMPDCRFPVGTDIGQRQQLAQQTRMHPRSHLRQMAVAVMLHALGTRRLARFVPPMNMERRDEQHRHVHRQQQPRSNMSLRQRIHNHKVTSFLSNITHTRGDFYDLTIEPLGICEAVTLA